MVRRPRMGTDEAKAIYKERAAERVSAQVRDRGLTRLPVRGPKRSGRSPA